MPDGWEAVQGKLASLVGEPTLDSFPAIRLRPTTAGQVALPRSKHEARTFTQSDLGVHFVRNTQIAAVRGYKLILTMPESMSKERRQLLGFLGATVALTPAVSGMGGAVAKANEILASTPDAFMPMQFNNPANPAVHRATTGPEIWRDTDGQVDAFVAGVGTGGTISGVGECLKKHKPGVRVVAIEPRTSPVLSGGKAGPHLIQGIGAEFVPETFNRAVVDEISRSPTTKPWTG